MLYTRQYLEDNNFIKVVTGPVTSDDGRDVTLWVIAKQFALYFVLFDTYYYFVHRFIFHSKVRRQIKSSSS